MGNNSISHKIDAYAQANLKALKQEEAKTGRKMTKFDIAQYMLQHGKLNKNEYANWMNTTEGFNAQAMTQQQKTALRQGNIWGFAGYGGGQESYLDSMTSFSQKTPVEQFNEIHSPRVKLNETVAERKKKAAEIQKHIQEQRVKKQILHPNEALKEQKFKDHISSLPEVDATYTELMNDIKFQNMDKKQKTEFLLKTTGQKFYEAQERGDKEAMKEYLKQGIGLTFAYMDDKAGITDIKEAAKKYSGLNAVVDAIDKFVDDGDNSNLSLGEKTWETIKGAGDAVDGFIGTQGAAFMGTLAVAGEAAAAAGIGKAFALVTQAYFAYEGGTMVVDGAVDVANAQNKEEARAGGQEVGTGAIMLGGVAKSVKSGKKNINKPTTNENNIETAPKPSAKNVKMEPKIKQTKQTNTDNKSKTLTPKEAETKANLDKAGFTEDVINQMRKDTQGSYGDLVPSTLKMIEYLENRIAKGEKLSPQMIDDAIQHCDGVYSQPGYGSEFQEIQKGLLGKYWNRAGELKEAYRKEGRFLTRKEAVQYKEAKTKETLEKAGFSEDVINQMRKDTQGSYGNLVPYTLKMIEYLENRIAKGEKLSPQMIDDAIQDCDGVYSQPGYGSKFQEIQKELLGKYWNRAGELKEAYRNE